MARGKKTGGRDVKPGEVLNPNGTRIRDPEVLAAYKEIRKRAKHELTIVANQYLRMSLTELKVCVKDESLPVLDHLFIRVLIHSLKSGDILRAHWLLKIAAPGYDLSSPDDEDKALDFEDYALKAFDDYEKTLKGGEVSVKNTTTKKKRTSKAKAKATSRRKRRTPKDKKPK